MDVTIIIAVISLLSVVVNSLIVSRNNKKLNESTINKNDSEAVNLQIHSASKIIQELSTELDRQKLQLDTIRKEVELLKGQEKVHLLEKIRLEEKIQSLVDENISLRSLVDTNKRSYTDKIKQLNDKIKQLSQELDDYTKK